MIGKAVCSLQKSPRFSQKRGDFSLMRNAVQGRAARYAADVPAAAAVRERPRREGNGTGEGSVPLEPLFPLGLLLQIFDRVAAKLSFRILLGRGTGDCKVNKGAERIVAVHTEPECIVVVKRHVFPPLQIGSAEKR